MRALRALPMPVRESELPPDMPVRESEFPPESASGDASPEAEVYPVLRVGRDGAGGWGRDRVVTEYPLTLLVNGEELATIVCTPTHLDELAVGFLVAEGVLGREEAKGAVTLLPGEGIAVVSARRPEGVLAAARFGRRYVGSCCGKSRTSLYLTNDVGTTRPVRGDLRITPEECLRRMEDLRVASDLFRKTGGVHNAALALPGRLDVVRTDIGRHNALDKLYGHVLLRGISPARRVVVFSGRVSSEVLLKVAKMGSPVVLSASAPTGLAIELARSLNVTLVGFVRGGRLNVYTHARRIAG